MGKKNKSNEKSSLAKKMMDMGVGDFEFLDDEDVQGVKNEELQISATEVLNEIAKESEDVHSLKLMKSREGSIIFKVPIDKIDSPKFHDRKYIPQSTIMKLAESFKIHGQAQPILLRRKEDGRYERIAGYLRIEAAKLLGWDSIYAFIVDVDDVTAFKLMIAENQYREDLTDFDKMETALYAIELLAGLSFNDVKKFFYLISNKENGLNKQSITEEELELKQKIIKILKELNISGWETFGKMLKLYSNIHPKVKELMIKNGWRYFVAYELNKITKDPELFEQVLKLIEDLRQGKDERVLLSHSEMKNLIKKAKTLINKDNKEVFPYRGFSEKFKSFKKLTHKVRKNWDKLSNDEKKLLDERFSKAEEVLSKLINEIEEIV